MKFEIPVEKNEYYNITITDLGNGGEGIGKIKGFTVFVEGGLPGDEIEILIVKVKKAFAYGKLTKFIKPSPNRVEPLCKYSSRCGGCQLQHFSYEAQLKFKTKKVKDSIERIGGLKDINVLPAIGMENPYHYRNKAQFPVGEQNGDVKIGFYAQRSHNIVDINRCIIQHDVNDKVIEVVRKFIKDYNIPVYNEENHSGLIRHILTKIGFTTGEIMVCLVLNGNKLPYSEKLVERLTKIQGVTSIVLNKNTKKTNVILGEKIEKIWGQNVITDYIGNIKFEISPFSFFQVNPVQTKILYQTALDMADLNGDERVLDIYCGIGTISLFFAQSAKSVFGVEIIPQAIFDAKRNAEINKITNVNFRVGAAEDIIPKLFEEEGFKADVVVVDPPRKGCEESVLRTIIDMKPNKVVYVSCDPATLARDLKMLSENGFRIGDVQPVDQFCQSIHVETCVLLSHKNS